MFAGWNTVKFNFNLIILCRVNDGQGEEQSNERKTKSGRP